MRSATLAITSLLVASTLSKAATSAVDVTYLDNFLPLTSPGSATPITNTSGVPIAEGSVIQIGYFAGPGLGQDPATYTAADWASFQPVSGAGSANPQYNTRTDTGLPGFMSLGVTFDDADDPAPASLPTGSSRRIGVRIFDSADENGFYNTVTSAQQDWEFRPLSDNIQPPGNASLDARVPSTDGNPAPGLVWEDNANPFVTSIPEPSSALLALVGMAFLARRRR
ncbi:MAG: hypothetical protein CMO40_05640 [Verrucomicrobiaceae bacterium]|nr:hypothetical protein [Verrucomicrobiaceae bacterium]